MRSDEMNITIKKNKLLTVLVKNKEKHVDNFKKAKAAFKDKALSELNGRIGLIESGRSFDMNFSLPVPISYEKDYARAIGMLEFHMGESIELSQELYRKFIDDEWDWSRQFGVSTMSYVDGD